MDEEQFEKDRRNRWAQTRVIVDELKGIRSSIDTLVILSGVFLIELALIVLFMVAI